MQFEHAIDSIVSTSLLLLQFIPFAVAQHSSLFHRLLAHRKEYVRRFASESFAFLMRKVRVRDVPRVFEVRVWRSYHFLVLFTRILPWLEHGLNWRVWLCPCHWFAVHRVYILLVTKSRLHQSCNMG